MNSIYSDKIFYQLIVEHTDESHPIDAISIINSSEYSEPHAAYKLYNFASSGLYLPKFKGVTIRYKFDVPKIIKKVCLATFAWNCPYTITLKNQVDIIETKEINVTGGVANYFYFNKYCTYLDFEIVFVSETTPREMHIDLLGDMSNALGVPDKLGAWGRI